MIVYCIVRKRTREEYETGWSFGEAWQWHTRLETMCVRVCLCVCVCGVCVCVILYSAYNIFFSLKRLSMRGLVYASEGGGGGGGGRIPLHIEWPVRDWLIRLNSVGRRPKQPVRVRQTKCQRANTCDKT